MKKFFKEVRVKFLCLIGYFGNKNANEKCEMFEKEDWYHDVGI